MRVTIVGGGLQGVELCWLAQKAGWGTLLVDERPAPPALRLADVFAQCDVTKLGGSGVLTRKVEHQILGTDIVIPALENAAALAALDGWCAREGMLFAFDPCAYEGHLLQTEEPRPFPALRYADPATCGKSGYKGISDHSQALGRQRQPGRPVCSAMKPNCVPIFLRDSMPRDGFWNRTAPVRPFHWRYVEHPETTESFR
ncbi:hypothetical protein [Bilophila wadsworthia]|uniref:hypothetical protein n=1 Tax=Bilophila wadsworthia TaxID=35833 RepID=UPI0035218195